MNRTGRVLLVLFALSAIGYFPLSQWAMTTRFGTSSFFLGQLVYLLPVGVCFFALPVFVVGLIFEYTRRRSLFVLWFSALLLACCFLGASLARGPHMAGMWAFAERSQPLIAAIERYERDHSAPPQWLSDLVPNYLPTVPSTGMGAYPEYRYLTGRAANERYPSNPWALEVFTPSGSGLFDMMLYLPSQDYQKYAEIGRLEPVGDWVYVNE